MYPRTLPKLLQERGSEHIRDVCHPLHTFFELLPSGKQLQSQKGRVVFLISEKHNHIFAGTAFVGTAK